MTNLVTESGVVSLKDVINQVNRNIEWLKAKLANVSVGSYASQPIRKFYEDRIELQKINLAWLKRALDNNIQG